MTDPRQPIRIVLAALVIAVLTGGVIGVSLPAHAASCVADPLLCPSRVHFGVSMSGLPRDVGRLDTFGAAVGKSPGVAMYFQSFKDPFDATGLRGLTDTGRLPMITWEPYDALRPADNPYPLRSIAAGTFDDYLRAQAEKTKSVGAPVAIRFGHEMNGYWYPWGQGTNGNTPQDYVAAYRHVHDIFSGAGATNVVWVWAPNLDDFNRTQDLGALYPGDTYVDWLGISGYFDETTDTFANLYPSTLAQFDRIAPTKPIYIAETSVLPGLTRPAMIRDLLRGLLATPRLVGFTWFDHVTRFDWRIENDPAALAAFSDELSSAWFSSPGTAQLPVAPLSQLSPTISGTAQDGFILSRVSGAWRPNADSGAVGYAGRWYRCTDAASTASCVATAATSPNYTATKWDVGRFLRYQVTATNSTGSTVAWSKATTAILIVPAKPGAPTVEARDGAVRVTFPVAPAHTSYWRLTVDGVVQPLISVGAAQHWLLGLTNGRSYDLNLQAVNVTRSLFSPATSGTIVPMSLPHTPYIKFSGATATFFMPPVPLGAAAWVLVFNGALRTVPVSTLRYSVADLAADVDHSWRLQAAAGTMEAQAWGSLTPVIGGSFRLPATA